MLLHPYSTAVGVLGPRQPLNKDTITYNVMGKIKSSILIILICTMSFVSGYTSVSKTSFVFASAPDGYTQANSNADLVSAFRAYCKSRNLAIDGSVADAITTFTTSTFNNICNKLGIDPTSLQAELYYKTSGNSGLQWFFTSSGVSAYNRIFAEFLQNNNLQVGDTVNNQTLQSGLFYKDLDGYACWVTICTSLPATASNKISAVGSAWKNVSSSSISSYVGSNITIHCYNSNNQEVTYSYPVTSALSGSYINYFIHSTAFWSTDKTTEYNEVVVACTNYNQDVGYLMMLVTTQNPIGVFYLDNFSDTIKLKDNTVNATVYITTNNTTINNNIYEGDTIINPDGTPENPGGGGGGDEPTPDLPEPDLDPAEDWDIELPDLNINWILSGKQNKFPFDIPFNVMYALELLQAEPEAPRIQGTLDLAVYQWNYDLDLSDFDSVASICRNMEFLAFLTGLMLMTRKLIWG